jgi:flagellin
MALTINTNVGSMNAQRQLGNTGQALSKTLGRLASGLRINSASDDAAGLAISERLNSQVRGLNQAQRNANDGISLLQTAESALTESTDILQRMRELSVQSANDTNTDADRDALQLEVDQLKQEFDRIADTTQFNGSNVLDGTFQNGATFQVGANAGQTITVAIQASGTRDMGSSAQATGAGPVTAVALDTGDTINGVALKSSTNYASATPADGRSEGSAYAKAAAINASNTGAVAKASATSEGAVTIEAILAAETFSVNGTEIVDASTAITADAAGASALTSLVNAQTSETGVTATANGADVTLTAADGRDVLITAGGAGTADEAGFAATTRSDVTLTSSEAITMGGSANTKLGFTGTSIAVSGSLDTVDISTQQGASDAIVRLDSALETLASRRAGMGAVQNRLDTTISNLANVSENLSAARSRVLDADFAAETANLSKQQILQQSGVAALSQANSSSQIALSLLR